MGGLGGLFDLVFDGAADDLRFGQVAGLGCIGEFLGYFCWNPNADHGHAWCVRAFLFCFHELLVGANENRIKLNLIQLQEKTLLFFHFVLEGLCV